jgi:hypothetical protein
MLFHRGSGEASRVAGIGEDSRVVGICGSRKETYPDGDQYPRLGCVCDGPETLSGIGAVKYVMRWFFMGSGVSS